jgi:hypothetical protein
MATYIFSADFFIGADSEALARDGLMELLAEIVRADDSSVFELIDIEGE